MSLLNSFYKILKYIHVHNNLNTIHKLVSIIMMIPIVEETHTLITNFDTISFKCVTVTQQ